MYVCTFTDGRGFYYLLASAKHEVIMWERRETAIAYMISLNRTLHTDLRQFSWVLLTTARLFNIDKEELKVMMPGPYTSYKIKTENGAQLGIRIHPKSAGFFKQIHRSEGLAGLCG